LKMKNSLAAVKIISMKVAAIKIISISAAAVANVAAMKIIIIIRL